MPNILLISLDGISVSSGDMYSRLVPKLISRAVVHESITTEDALNYIGSGWPNTILVSDPAVTRKENSHLLTAVADCVKHGCTLVFMGSFAAVVQYDQLDKILKEKFGLGWKVAAYTKHDVEVIRHSQDDDQKLIRKTTLSSGFYAKALYLEVPLTDVVCAGGPKPLAYAAFTRAGLGKVGYIGDVNFREESEKVILAMCHLDRPEDKSEAMEEA